MCIRDSFYVVLAAAFGFMLHVRGCHKQKYSEACRPILGKHTDGLAGTLIDLMAVFALLAGTTTTFTLATPLMSQIVSELFGFSDTRLITIAILAVTCLVYTVSVVSGMKGIQKQMCIRDSYNVDPFHQLTAKQTTSTI